jgi:hypothetical protein
MKKSFYYLFFMLFIFSACEKIEVDNDDKNYSMDLLIQQNENIIQLSWTETNVSTFERYIIIRSPQPFPDDLTSPNTIFFPMEMVASIEDHKVTTYEDFGSVLSEKVYYKVFADIGSRFLSSGSVEASIDIDILPFSFFKATFSPALDKLFFIEENGSQFGLRTIDYKTGASAQSSTQNISSYYFDFQLGTNGSEERLFVFEDFYNKIYVYEPSGLGIQKTYNTNYSIYSVASSSSGLICAAVGDHQGSIHLYSPTSNGYIKRHNLAAYHQDRRVACISDTENEFIDASWDQLHYYKFSSTGTLSEHTSTSIQIGGGMNEKIAVSPDNQYFLFTQDGAIFKKDLSVYKTLDNQNNSLFFTGYEFSEDGNTLYAMDGFSRKILVYNFPSLELTRSVQLGYTPTGLHMDEGKLIVYGIGFDSQTGSSRGVYQSFNF